MSISSNDGEDSPALYTGPVPESDATYLRQAAAHLKPLSEDDYMTGPAVLLHTMAKHSYVLDDRNLYWCVEWDPGLLVIRMAPDQTMSWVALRSPVPDFGGREPLPQDGAPGDYKHEDNPQYNLIFTPWDAQYDEQKRECGSFVPADVDIEARFEDALSCVNALGSVMESRYSEDTDRWIELCKQNLKKWCGDGVRLKPARYKSQHACVSRVDQ